MGGTEAGTDTALTSVTQVLAGYHSGFEIVGASSDVAAIELFTIVPARGMPRLLLPTKGPAMSTALKSFIGGRRWSRVAPSVLQIVSKTAGATPVLSRDVALVSESFDTAPVRSLLADVLGRTDFEMAFRLSVGRPNAKTVAMAVSTEGVPLCFAKFGSEEMTNSLVRYEGEVLSRLRDSDLPIVMPEVLYADVWAGDHHALITRSVEMEPLKRGASEAHHAADALTVAGGVEADQLRSSHYWKRIVDRVDQVVDDAVDRPFLNRARDFIDAQWGDTVFDFGMAHGDWARPNLGRMNGKIVALDWERCMDTAPRGSDIAHFAVIESSISSGTRLLDIDSVESNTRHYLDEVGLSALLARPLIVLDLLEMVLRFASARAAGIPSRDVRFGPGLQAALLHWTR